jgi:transposase
LQSEGIESHIVDPASIATSRRRRRAKTDRVCLAWALDWR